MLLENGNNIFIEFKTDSSSRRDKQDENLKVCLQNVGMKEILNGILKIYSATTYKRKYFYLINKLTNAELLLEKSLGYEIIPSSDAIEILYIQPISKEENEIGLIKYQNL